MSYATLVEEGLEELSAKQQELIEVHNFSIEQLTQSVFRALDYSEVCISLKSVGGASYALRNAPPCNRM